MYSRRKQSVDVDLYKQLVSFHIATMSQTYSWTMARRKWVPSLFVVSARTAIVKSKVRYEKYHQTNRDKTAKRPKSTTMEDQFEFEANVKATYVARSPVLTV